MIPLLFFIGVAIMSLNNINELFKNHPTFIIAEIGQNHQGDINLAKKLIKTAKECGADCVKFQKTCLSEKFNKAALNRPYNSPNSWGTTYGEHKKYLEFSNKEFLQLQQYANEIGIYFTASAMDLISLKFLAKINVPFIKIGSGDGNNFILIKEAAKLKIPLVISTGMQNLNTVKNIYKTVVEYHENFALLHCVSAYPTPIEEINLNVIQLYQKEFPNIKIGYSGHELGINITLASVALGAKIVERHITIDKNLKGSDHKCSLEPNEFYSLVKNIRTLETALGKAIKCRQKCEELCYKKLGKSLVFSKNLKKGHIIKEQDLKVKVAEPKGIDGALIETVIGKILKGSVNKDETLLEIHLK